MVRQWFDRLVRRAFRDVGIAIENGNLPQAERCAQRWAAIFPGSFYIEIQRAGQPDMDNQVRQAVALPPDCSCRWLPRIRSSFFKDEFTAHEARTASPKEKCWPTAPHQALHDQQCFKTQARNAALFSDLPGALQNSIEIAKRAI